MINVTANEIARVLRDVECDVLDGQSTIGIVSETQASAILLLIREKEIERLETNDQS